VKFADVSLAAGMTLEASPSPASYIARRAGRHQKIARPVHLWLWREEGSPLTQDHLERAVRAELHEGGKLAESGLLE
jgi:hypothetical protein